MKLARIAVFSLAFSTLSFPAAAENWLKIDPSDPYSDQGVFHLFDVDSAMEDTATGLVAARMVFRKPEEVAGGGVSSWMVWAFDCTANTVFYVASASESGNSNVTADWHKNPHTLDKPVMGGVTNMFGKKLCALKGSWPKGELPRN